MNLVHAPGGSHVAILKGLLASDRVLIPRATCDNKPVTLLYLGLVTVKNHTYSPCTSLSDLIGQWSSSLFNLKVMLCQCGRARRIVNAFLVLADKDMSSLCTTHVSNVDKAKLSFES
jgi:hypothetical protein